MRVTQATMQKLTGNFGGGEVYGRWHMIPLGPLIKSLFIPSLYQQSLSFQIIHKKRVWKKLVEVRLLMQNLATLIRFFFICGAHRVLDSMKLESEALSLVKPLWVMGIVLPSHMETFSLPVCSSRLFDSVVTWWVAPESRISGMHLSDYLTQIWP